MAIEEDANALRRTLSEIGFVALRARSGACLKEREGIIPIGIAEALGAVSSAAAEAENRWPRGSSCTAHAATIGS